MAEGRRSAQEITIFDGTGVSLQLVVNLAVDADPAPIVKLAAELAQRFDAHLVGLAAADVPPLVATGEGLVYEGEVMQIQR
ncbi:hypothetical protein EN833_35885, partial [Mesorhizobium sp. M4B.F.Ca.ET.190.01.1.1]